MDIEHTIVAGLTRDQTFTVEEEHSAEHIGSGTVGVLSTPSMIAFMEITARTLLDKHLPDSHTSVGVQVSVSHLAACPLGAEVEARIEVLSVDGRRVTLTVEAWHGDTNLGAGTHQRVIVDKERFLEKAAS
jgi:predicted thioesterase